MSLVTLSTHIAATPEEVWKTVMDPYRLGEWVTIHRALRWADGGSPAGGIRDGAAGPPARREPRRSLASGAVQAMQAGRVGGSRAGSLTRSHRIRAARRGDGTHFDYRNEFRPPLGPVGALASRALVGGMPEREAKRTIERLRELLEDRDGSDRDAVS